ncbi:chemotaxis protein CheA [Bacteriovorax sp. Seq25_V]|uniref:chemotaxis protein CheA n=1 Tax=Bacteriovorax sp. Seq25_V TaxID=1201288 RepID=UPI00038A3014|nr:chemotaxis protein CheA [Bacteriovorax sp. Seq25_V]EQC46575.1 putative chemotaxis protein CheA [Bacteriovorax sp. Seq25_V]
MEDFERELKEDFLEESMQLLEDSEQAFLALENDKDSTDLLDQIFRLAHNLKGTSRAVGFGEVAEFTHEMENLILKLKTGEIEVSDYVVTILLECNDHISHMITTLRDDLDATFDSAEIIAKIIAVISGQGAPVETSHEEVEMITEEEVEFDDSDFDMDDTPAAEMFEEEVSFESSEEPAMEGDDVEISESALESLRELGIYDDSIMGTMDLKTAPETSMDEGLTIKKGDDIVAQAEAPVKASVAPDNVTPIETAKKTAAAPAPKKTEDESIRVALSRVEKLNNVVGELVILQTVLDQRRFTAIQDGLANKSIAQLGKLSKEIQEISMSLRMIPLKATLQKMNRIVRDTSKALDKTVNLTLIGEDTEIDKTVLEHLSDPLVHIVRNAVDHGLESTEGRIKAGKSEAGNVAIKAFHEGNNLVIEITDDGGGINPEVIRKKAIEKKLIPPNKEIPDHEMIQYIFHPGFSTKEQVTEVSGRGVGMDVVKTNIEKMSGDIKVFTEIGKGSVFKVCLPLTMAIIEGMVVRVGTEKYIIPLSQVHESLKPTSEIINSITGFGECLNLRGDVLPLFNIGKTLGRKMDDGDSTDKIAIIIHNDNFNYAVLVDDILHQQQVVIKKLGDEIKSNKGFMGSSILGDGRPSFILDLNELYSGSLKKSSNNLKDSLSKVA